MTPPDIDPPAEVAEEIVTLLEESDDQQLREVIHYAQQLLQEHPALTEEIDAREGEELVRIDDEGDYTTVVVERPDASGEARGPFAYRVQWQPDIEGGEGRYEWHYLGHVGNKGAR